MGQGSSGYFDDEEDNNAGLITARTQPPPQVPEVVAPTLGTPKPRPLASSVFDRALTRSALPNETRADWEDRQKGQADAGLLGPIRPRYRDANTEAQASAQDQKQVQANAQEIDRQTAAANREAAIAQRRQQMDARRKEIEARQQATAQASQAKTDDHNRVNLLRDSGAELKRTPDGSSYEQAKRPDGSPIFKPETGEPYQNPEGKWVRPVKDDRGAWRDQDLVGEKQYTTDRETGEQYIQHGGQKIVVGTDATITKQNDLRSKVDQTRAAELSDSIDLQERSKQQRELAQTVTKLSQTLKPAEKAWKIAKLTTGPASPTFDPEKFKGSLEVYRQQVGPLKAAKADLAAAAADVATIASTRDEKRRQVLAISADIAKLRAVHRGVDVTQLGGVQVPDVAGLQAKAEALRSEADQAVGEAQTKVQMGVMTPEAFDAHKAEAMAPAEAAQKEATEKTAVWNDVVKRSNVTGKAIETLKSQADTDPAKAEELRTAIVDHNTALTRGAEVLAGKELVPDEKGDVSEPALMAAVAGRAAATGDTQTGAAQKLAQEMQEKGAQTIGGKPVEEVVRTIKQEDGRVNASRWSDLMDPETLATVTPSLSLDEPRKLSLQNPDGSRREVGIPAEQFLRETGREVDLNQRSAKVAQADEAMRAQTKAIAGEEEGRSMGLSMSLGGQLYAAMNSKAEAARTDPNRAAIEQAKKDREEALQGLPQDQRDEVERRAWNQRITSALDVAKGIPKDFSTKMKEVQQDPEQLIPFISSAKGISALVELGGAAGRLKEGKATREDVLALSEYVGAQGQKVTTGYEVGSVLAALPAFAGELAATGGIYTAAEGVAFKGGAKLLQRLGMKGGEEILAKLIAEKAAGKGFEQLVASTAKTKALEFVARSAASLVGSAAQTVPASALRITEGTLQRMLPQVEFQPGDDRRIQAVISKDGDSFGKALAKAAGDQYTEVFSEHAGSALKFIPIPARLQAIKTAIAARWFKANPGSTAEAFAKTLHDAGWHGVLGEMFEERVGDVAKSAMGLQSWGDAVPTLHQLLVEGISFAVPGAAIGAANLGMTAGANMLAGSAAKVQNRDNRQAYTSLLSTRNQLSDAVKSPEALASLNEQLQAAGKAPMSMVAAHDALQAIDDHVQSVASNITVAEVPIAQRMIRHLDPNADAAAIVAEMQDNPVMARAALSIGVQMREDAADPRRLDRMDAEAAKQGPSAIPFIATDTLIGAHILQTHLPAIARGDSTSVPPQIANGLHRAGLVVQGEDGSLALTPDAVSMLPKAMREAVAKDPESFSVFVPGTPTATVGEVAKNLAEHGEQLIAEAATESATSSPTADATNTAGGTGGSFQVTVQASNPVTGPKAPITLQITATSEADAERQVRARFQKSGDTVESLTITAPIQNSTTTNATDSTAPTQEALSTAEGGAVEQGEQTHAVAGSVEATQGQIVTPVSTSPAHAPLDPGLLVARKALAGALRPAIPALKALKVVIQREGPSPKGARRSLSHGGRKGDVPFIRAEWTREAGEPIFRLIYDEVLLADIAVHAKLRPEDVTAYAEKAVREELIHFASLEVIRQEWAGSKGTFHEFYREYMGRIHDGMTKAQRKASRDLYGPAGLQLSPPDLAAEHLRQLVQLAEEGQTTETFAAYLMEHFRKVLAVLQKLLKDKATWSKPLQEAFDLTTKVLAAAEKKAEKPTSYAMLKVAENQTAPFIAFGKTIAEEDLYQGEEGSDSYGNDGYGRETEPHITAFYGLDTQEPGPVKKALAEFGPVSAKLGKVTLFENADKPYDVVKVDISGADVHRLNAELAKLPHRESDFPDYHPHLTIAYVKKGRGKKYVGAAPFTGTEITFDSLAFSDAERNKTTVPLAKTPSPDATAATPEAATGEASPAVAAPLSIGDDSFISVPRSKVEIQRKSISKADSLPAKDTATPAPAETGAAVATSSHKRASKDYIAGIKPIAALRAPNYREPFESVLGVTLTNPQTVDLMVEMMQLLREQGEPALIDDSTPNAPEWLIEKAWANLRQPAVAPDFVSQIEQATGSAPPAAFFGRKLYISRLHEVWQQQTGETIALAQFKALLLQQLRAGKLGLSRLDFVPIDRGQKAEYDRSYAASEMVDGHETFHFLNLPEAASKAVPRVNADAAVAARKKEVKAEVEKAPALPTVAEAKAAVEKKITPNPAQAAAIKALSAPARSDGSTRRAEAARKLKEKLKGGELASAVPALGAPAVAEKPAIADKETRLAALEYADALMEDGITDPAEFLTEVQAALGFKSAKSYSALWNLAQLSGADLIEQSLADWSDLLSAQLTKPQTESNQSHANSDTPEQPVGERGGDSPAADIAGDRSGIQPGDVQPGGRVGSEQSAAADGVGAGRDTDAPDSASAGGDIESPAAGSGSTRGPATAPQLVGTGGDVRRTKQQPSSVAPAAGNFVITEADRIGKGTLGEKYADNIAAIRTLKAIEAENRPATLAEQRILARYVGWGGIKNVFVPDKEDWKKRHDELKALLTPEEHAQAQSTMGDAHYTSPTVVGGIFKALTRFGFFGGKMIEGGVGIGNFIGLLPESMRARTSYLGVEKDGITARIAQHLYPQATIVHSKFEEADIERDHFDASAGNPPFGQQHLFDARHKEASKFSIHNFFIAKQIEALRPGGIGAWVVSHYFLDALDPAARKWINERAEFLGAIRLPNTAFKENARTEVTTDMVFFRKRSPGETAGESAWTDTGSAAFDGKPVKMNRYFVDHPEMMLGRPSMEGTMHPGQFEFTLHPIDSEGTLDEQLSKAVDRLPAGVYDQQLKSTTERLAPKASDIPEGVKVGGYFVKGGAIHRRGRDVNTAQTAEPVAEVSKTTAERIKGLIPLRDALNRLVKAELSDAPVKELTRLRTTLNKAYDSFVAKHGFLNELGNRRAFAEDTDAFRVLALERDFDPGVSAATAKTKGLVARKPSAKKADIFTARVNVGYQEITQAATAEDALAVSLNQRGEVDPDYMAKLTGKTREAIIDALGPLIYQTPEGTWQRASQYLSGNVREKLAKAREAAKTDATMQRNVEALDLAMPPDVAPSDIRIPLGSGWVGEDTVRDFARELTGNEPSIVAYTPGLARWNFSHTAAGTAETQLWGSPGASFGELMDAILNSKSVLVYHPPDQDGRRSVDTEKTAAAQTKADEIKAKWSDWVMQDPARRERLARIYNETMNNFVDPKHDGAHMTLPGKSAAITLYPHQMNGANRIITDRVVLLDQVVGAGKTFEIVVGAMEMKRLGIARKHLVVVPNHLTTQWRDAFVQLYPNSNILFATPKDFQKNNRQKLFAKIMTGEFDAVIVGHSSLKKIGMPAGGEAEVLNEMLSEITEAIESMRRAERTQAGKKQDSRFISGLEKMKQSMEAKIKKAMDRTGAKDQTATFDELGIDAITVDEAHEFKNLFYTTSMQRVAGLGDPAGSARAFDLYVKLRWMQKRYAGKAPVVFATGTPVSNSLVEMFTMQRYLIPDVLQKMGLTTLDAWAKVFGDVKSVYEVDPSGTGYRMSTRFASFLNVGDLAALYRTFADVVTLQDLHDQAGQRGERFPVPKMLGGKPENIVVPRSEAQAAFFGHEIPQLNDKGEELVDGDGNPVVEYTKGSILDRIKNMPKDPSVDNMLKVTTDARRSSLDMRLVHPSAADNPHSKVNHAVGEIVKVYKEWHAKKGTQLVFCDLSVPSSAKGKATAKAKEAAAGTFIRALPGASTVDGVPYSETYEIVDNAAPVDIDGGKHSFFVFKDKFGDFIVSEQTTGKRLAGAKTKKAAVAQATETVAKYADKLDDLLAKNAIPLEVVTSLSAKAAGSESAEGSDEDEFADDSTGPAVSMDELLADQTKFSVYDDMRDKLIAAGIPAHEIAFIHDYDTPAAKQKLFDAMNSGEMRILMGSTPKMGAGTNVQKRAVALWHLDAPWKPSDLEQREGRIIRQGNLFYPQDPDGFHVRVARYASRQTYDARMWQLNEHKANGISQFRSADRSVREMEDVDGQAASAAEMKAAASGDPLIQREIELRGEVRKLDLLRRSFLSNQDTLAREVGQLKKAPDRLAATELIWGSVEKAAKANPRPEEFTGISRTDGDEGPKRGQTINDKGDVVALFRNAIAWAKLSGERRAPMMEYRGLTIEVRMNFNESAAALVAILPNRAGDRDGYLIASFTGDDKISGPGIIQRFDNFLDDRPLDALDSAKRQHANDLKKLAELEPLLGQPFTRQEQLDAKRKEHAATVTELRSNRRRPRGNADHSPGLSASVPNEGTGSISGAGSDKVSALNSEQITVSIRAGEPANVIADEKQLPIKAQDVKRPSFELINAYHEGKRVAERVDGAERFQQLARYGEEDYPEYIGFNKVKSLFWEAGLHGKEMPQWVRATRIGAIPIGGVSTNFRDQHAESGVSVLHLHGEQRSDVGTFDLFNDGERIDVEGWLHFKKGSDGEPIIVGARVAEKAPDSPPSLAASLPMDLKQISEERDRTIAGDLEGKAKEVFTTTAKDVYATFFKGRLDKLDYFAPGTKRVLLDSERESAFVRAAMGGMMDKVTADIERALGKTTNAAGQKRRKEFVAEILPTAARLNPIGYDKAGDLIFGDFNMRAGQMLAGLVEVDGPKGRFITTRDNFETKMALGKKWTIIREIVEGEWVDGQRDGEKLLVGPEIMLNGKRWHQLLRPMDAARQADIYEAFHTAYPEVAHWLDAFIAPDRAKARVLDVRGTKLPDFNRESLRDFFGEESPFGELSRVEGYTPEIFRTRSIAGAVADAYQSVINKNWKSAAREYKTGAAREMGQVKDLFQGFGIRSMEAHSERIRKSTAERLLKLTAKPIPPTTGLPPNWVALNSDTMNVLFEAMRIASDLNPAQFPALTDALNPAELSRLQSIVGEAYMLVGQSQMIRKEVLAELVRPLANRKINNKFLSVIDSLSRSTTGSMLAHPFTWTQNQLSNEIFKSMRAAQQALYGMLMAGVSARQSSIGNTKLAADAKTKSRTALYESAYVLRGLITDRWFFPGAKDRLNAVVPRELFEGNTGIAGAVQAMSEDKVTAFELLKQANVPGAILKSVRYGEMDIRTKQQISYAAYMAHASVAADDSGVTFADKAARMAWMREWLKTAPDDVHTAAYATAVTYALDYSNVPFWLDDQSQVKVFGTDLTPFVNLARRLAIPFGKYPYNFGRQMKRLGIDSIRTLSTKRKFTTQEQKAAAVANLGMYGLMAVVARVFLGAGGDDDDKVSRIGTSYDELAQKLDPAFDTSSRVNITHTPLGAAVAAAAHMFGDDQQHQDYWLRVRTIPYAPLGLLLSSGASALTSKQEGAQALDNWWGFVEDFISIGVGAKLAMAPLNLKSKYDAGKSFSTMLGETAVDVGLSRVAPAPLLATARDMVDPMARRLRKAENIGYRPGFIAGVESKIPGATKFLPPAGKIVGRKNLENAGLDLAKLNAADLPQAYKIDGDKVGFVNPDKLYIRPRWQTAARLVGMNVKGIDSRQYAAEIKARGASKRVK